jgi:hypothetical protein
MDRSASYRIIVIRNAEGYLAWAPAFPKLSGRARSARAAYKNLKDRISQDLSNRFASSEPIPNDPIVQTRTFRIDLWHLREKEELR